jgi:hypothetical protein
MPDPAAAIVFPDRLDPFYQYFDDPWLTGFILHSLIQDGAKERLVERFAGRPADLSDRMKYAIAVLYHKVDHLITRAEALALYDAIPERKSNDEPIPF